MSSRPVLLGAVLAAPPALLALSLPPGARAAGVTAALPALAGLVVLDRVLRRRVGPGTAFWTLVLAVYGTELLPLLAHAPDAPRAAAFLLGASALAILPPRPGPASGRQVAFVVALAAGAVLSAQRAPWAQDLPRALFGSRGGLLFWTPLLWASLVGLMILLRREGRGAAPVAAVGFAPFLAASLLERLDVALPALMVGLAAALDAAARLVQRRPAWTLAAALPPLAVSNLLFMEQYRHTLERDDTVSFPQVSEGNARLLAQGVGSPVAWPANWIWSARHRLPVERWDLVSGQRLDPRRGVAIDVGDLDQDAAFLLDGWSVRHPCADAICREIEGRAEMVVPVESAPARMGLRAAGPGAVRVWLNGADLGRVALGPDLSVVHVPAPGPWHEVNRIVFEPAPGTRALVDRLTLHRGER